MAAFFISGAAAWISTDTTALERRRRSIRPPPGPFRYVHMGSMATIGRKAAIADIGPFKLWGMAAWWLWIMSGCRMAAVSI